MSYLDENEVVIEIDEGIMDEEEDETESGLSKQREQENRTDHNERQREQAQRNEIRKRHKVRLMTLFRKVRRLQKKC